MAVPLSVTLFGSSLVPAVSVESMMRPSCLEFARCGRGHDVGVFNPWGPAFLRERDCLYEFARLTGYTAPVEHAETGMIAGARVTFFGSNVGEFASLSFEEELRRVGAILKAELRASSRNEGGTGGDGGMGAEGVVEVAEREGQRLSDSDPLGRVWSDSAYTSGSFIVVYDDDDGNG